ncbi:MAG TPA: LL-diaminopimelate aminotransferase [Chlamydiales bacterium]|jgi:LL-diaminopimelate aminotransferase|nr:LL-diaminopimelate aminotransferase [Chlamydiales bacterium]
MAKLNHHYTKLAGNYLFQEIERRTSLFREKFPKAELINLGIGDISRPLPPSITSALENASREMGSPDTFKGYGPSQGYLFLREAIRENDYKDLPISSDEIFISDGAKNDIANLQEIFDIDNKIAMPDPTYPVYIDTNVMAGRTRPLLKSGSYGGVLYLPCNEKNQFVPDLPNRACDLIYLCSPNNPTGVAIDREHLQKWVHYAQQNSAVILFDGAYEAYIRSPNCPRSIYEIEGAKEVAIEIRSFSKTAGFTGLRCSYTVVPKALKLLEGRQWISLHDLWKRRHDTKFNGVSYPIQKAAAAVYSPQGKAEVKALIDSYLEQSNLLLKTLTQGGFKAYGGIDAPYLWVKAPAEATSWHFFDYLLEKTHIISVPGSGFGAAGEGFVRLSAFGPFPLLIEASKRLVKV